MSDKNKHILEKIKQNKQYKIACQNVDSESQAKIDKLIEQFVDSFNASIDKAVNVISSSKEGVSALKEALKKSK